MQKRDWPETQCIEGNIKLYNYPQTTRPLILVPWKKRGARIFDRMISANVIVHDITFGDILSSHEEDKS